MRGKDEGSRLATIGLVCCLLILFTSCERDDAGPSVNPSIDFVEGDGYVTLSDTFPVSDTLLVGVVIRKGDDDMNIFKVITRYDNGPEQTRDSLAMGTDVFEFDKTIILRDQAGSEKWTFAVQEDDGDVIRRSLTFTVE